MGEAAELTLICVGVSTLCSRLCEVAIRQIPGSARLDEDERAERGCKRGGDDLANARRSTGPPRRATALWRASRFSHVSWRRCLRCEAR